MSRGDLSIPGGRSVTHNEDRNSDGIEGRCGHSKEVYETGGKCVAGFKDSMKIVFEKLLPKWNYRAVPQPR